MNNLEHQILDNGCSFSFSAKSNSKEILFLDRDGVLINDSGYPHKINDIKLMDQNLEVLSGLSNKYEFIVITNQSGIDRNLFTWEDYYLFTDELFMRLKEYNVLILAIIAIPFHPDYSISLAAEKWRKPQIESLNFLKRVYSFKDSKSCYIGDKVEDIHFAYNAGFEKAILLKENISNKELDNLESMRDKLNIKTSKYLNLDDI
tara:strand:- start:31 stop:642 length:612 start_codon:yes stop_codon:yes gene_type:complete